MPVFLGLTAEETFWDTSKKILFLGEWCRLPTRRAVWNKIPHDVAKYPWNDRQRLFKSYAYVNSLYERRLEHLGNKLNTVFGENHTPRYWRILLGPWLSTFLQILYERYICLHDAVSQYPGVDTWIIPEEDVRPPSSFEEFTMDYTGDNYNLALYSDIIHHTHNVRFQVKSSPLHPPRLSRGRRGLRPLLDSVLWRLGKRNSVAMISSSFPVKANILLHWRRKQVPLLGPIPETLIPMMEDKVLRPSLVEPGGDDSFDVLCRHMIPRHLPVSYVEGRDVCRERAQRVFPRSPKVILTANAAIGSDLFKYWAGEQSEKGVPLGLIQHGGHYGAGAWNSHEDHERAIADCFYSWGWSPPEASNVKPFVAPKLIRRWPKPRVHGRVLLVLNSSPRYSYWMYSIPVGPQHLDYLADQVRFIGALDAQARPLLQVRLYAKDYGWAEKDLLAEKFPDVPISSSGTSFLRELETASLYVGTGNGTTFLETFAANFPSVLFWNPQHWEIRAAARPFFDELRRVRILHETPEDAARFVNTIASDPYSWWSDIHVQSVVSKFSGQFGRKSNSIETWNLELQRFACSRGVKKQ